MTGMVGCDLRDLYRVEKAEEVDQSLESLADPRLVEKFTMLGIDEVYKVWGDRVTRKLIPSNNIRKQGSINREKHY
jgi:hypothetical protein